MSDRLRVLEALRTAGSRGMHSHDLRKLGYTGNPSQRIAELRSEGHVIEGVMERRGRRNGIRWHLIHDTGGSAGTGQESSAEEAGVPSGVGVGAVPVSSSPEESAAGIPGRSPGPARTSSSGNSGRATEGPAARLFDPPLAHDQEVA